MKIKINKKTPKENITTVDEDGIEWVCVSSTETVHDGSGNLIAGESVRYSTDLSPEEEAVLRERAKSENLDIRVGVAENIGCPPDLLDELSDDEFRWVRAGVADNVNTPVETLMKLSTDEDFNVRANVAYNPNTPYEVLKAMKEAEKSYDDYEDSKGSVFESLELNENSKRPGKSLEYIEDCGLTPEKIEAAKDSMMEQVLSDLTSDKKMKAKSLSLKIISILSVITEILIIPLIIFGFVTGSWSQLIFDIVALVVLYFIRKTILKAITRRVSTAVIDSMEDIGLLSEDERVEFEKDLLQALKGRGRNE